MSQELRLIRRITLKLIPFLILLYLIAYVDRSAVGFAKLHMGTDIGIGDVAYGLGAGLFFIGYFLLLASCIACSNASTSYRNPDSPPARARDDTRLSSNPACRRL